MNRKMFAGIVLSLLLLLTVHVQSASAPIVIPNLDEMIVETIDEPESMDPHWAYDTASEQLIMNVYETLIFFDYESVDSYLFQLADSMITPNAVTYRFRIRQNVPWHDPVYGVVTPQDVEYSFERGMVMDRGGGPMWMLLEPLLSIKTTREYDLSIPGQAAILGQLIDDAVVITDAAGNPDPAGEYVQFNLDAPFAPFMQILSQPWSSIIDRDWAIANGCWPSWDPTYTTWVAWNNPPISPLDVAFTMMGTGPYMLGYDSPYGLGFWMPGVAWSIVRFDDYWRGWAVWPGDPGVPRGNNFVSRATVNFLFPQWADRYADFTAGAADIVYVPRPFIGMVNGFPGVRGVRDLPTLTLDAMFFNYDVDPESPFMPTIPIGGVPTAAPDLFADINMRTAFAHSFDYAQYISTIWLSEAEQPANPIIAGLDFYNPAAPRYSYDLVQATAEFAAAWGGTVWANGFTTFLVYNEGNVERQAAALMLENAVENMIPWPPTADVDVIPIALAWPGMLDELVDSDLPLWISSWRGDFADPDDFVEPFMHSQGAISQFQNIQYGQFNPLWTNDFVDAQIETRNYDLANLYNVQLIYYGEVPSVPIAQPLTRHWERDWVQGWYYNPLHGGSHLLHNDDAVFYFYHLWKGLDADINGDGIINVLDIGQVNAHWYPGPPQGILGYHRVADIYPVSEMDSEDYIIPGADERVDIYDLALINAQWLDEIDP